MRIEQVDGQSAVTRLQAHSPLRLLAPRSAGKSAWVFTSTFGGGLLAGDRIDLEVEVGQGATCLLGTQSQTKVYRSDQPLAASQVLNAQVAIDATLIALPDAIACFRNANFAQQQRIDLAPSASLCWLDWFTSGRRARGERWAFRSYISRADITVGNKLIFRDALRLDATDGKIDHPYRMGNCDCFATALLIGPRFANYAKELLIWSSTQPAAMQESVIFAASPVSEGVVLRVAGATTEAVGRWLRNRLGCITQELGDDPWERKW
ncbi:MAG TPA: urease accessory protein UreD [Humisphaera sp.]|nr:urease accessory protein UreD [Humisphaera sp.]